MDRAAARAAAKSAILALELFNLVVAGAPDSFNGAARIALVTSRSQALEPAARQLYSIVNQITVSLYILRAPGEEEQAEDTLDALALAVFQALHETGDFAAGESDAGRGAPNALVDGRIYRVERLPFTVVEEEGY